MELVTGRAGTPHITSQQHRQMHQGIWGEEAYILNTGNMLEPEVQSSNKILIKDGALMFQGALFSVKVGTTDEITINNGNQGMKRKDLVVVRYTYDQSQNIESAEWKVIQGAPAESNPVAPSGTSGDIQVGDSAVDCPFMIVNLDGINVTGVDIIPEKIQTIPELIGDLQWSEWANAGSNAGLTTTYRKNKSMVEVYVQGTLDNVGFTSQTGYTVGTLPVGARPPYARRYQLTDSRLYMDITASGTVSIMANTNIESTRSVISFSECFGI